jgi:hypothetical protein
MIELMIVVAIISVLAAIAIPQFLIFSAKSKRAEGIQLLSGFHKAQVAHYAGNDVFLVENGALGIPLKLPYSVPSPPKFYDINNIDTSNDTGTETGDKYIAYLEAFGTGLDEDGAQEGLCIFYPVYFLGLCCDVPSLAGKVQQVFDDITNTYNPACP